MNRRNLLWVALLGLPLAVVGGLAYADNSKAQSFTCPLTGEELPCSKCCPLNDGTAKQTFICPATGEELPCEKCCPLNVSPRRADAPAPAVAQAPMPHAKTQAGEYICPITGEPLGCPNCCPLNKAKK
jgi:hypothetical protein